MQFDNFYGYIHCTCIVGIIITINSTLYETVLMMYMYVCVCMFVCLHEQASLRKGQGGVLACYPVSYIGASS